MGPGTSLAFVPRAAVRLRAFAFLVPLSRACARPRQAAATLWPHAACARTKKELNTTNCTLGSGVSPTSQTFTQTDNGAFECGYGCSTASGPPLSITYEKRGAGPCFDSIDERGNRARVASPAPRKEDTAMLVPNPVLALAATVLAFAMAAAPTASALPEPAPDPLDYIFVTDDAARGP